MFHSRRFRLSGPRTNGPFCSERAKYTLTTIYFKLQIQINILQNHKIKIKIIILISLSIGSSCLQLLAASFSPLYLQELDKKLSFGDAASRAHLFRGERKGKEDPLRTDSAGNNNQKEGGSHLSITRMLSTSMPRSRDQQGTS